LIIAVRAIAAAGLIGAALVAFGGKDGFAQTGGAPAAPSGTAVVAPAGSAPASGPVLRPPPAPASALLPPTLDFIDEVKVGGLVHDVTMETSPRELGADVNLELLFRPLFTPVDVYGFDISLRPHVGASINTSGDTSQAYFGLTLGIGLAHDVLRPGDRVFLNGTFGGSVHDGYLDGAPPGRKDLGSRLLSRKSAELGYQVTPRYSVSLIIDHISNYGWADHNDGIKTAGVRLGIKF
jgi:lipid A 3-O-deacylase